MFDFAWLQQLVPGDAKPSSAAKYTTQAGRPCQIQLVVTPFGPNVPKLRAHHSSILIDNVEYSFGGAGICRAEGPMSHVRFRREKDRMFFNFGVHQVNHSHFEKTLKEFFRAGSYDVLRKNCNSFSDCALFFLTGKRMERKYRRIERIGSTADQKLHLFQALTGGGYRPNARAALFKLDAVIDTLKQERKAMLVGSPERANGRSPPRAAAGGA